MNQIPSLDNEKAPKYRMVISMQTVDKLGVKLYDKVSAVLAELVANSYDADATEVEIRAPMGQYLTAKTANVSHEVKDLTIEVIDNGIGMTPDEVNSFYLRVGAERRRDPLRGDKSRLYGRKVMGRKGVGKLAPFGICERIEVVTSGGGLVKGKDENGNGVEGYVTAHLILDKGQILSDHDEEYFPIVGQLDGIVRPKSGTLLRLTGFEYRYVPKIDDLDEQLSQRFGISAANWKITLFDTAQEFFGSYAPHVVGVYNVPKMEGTEIKFVQRKRSDDQVQYSALAPDGKIYPDFDAGFEHEGKFYPVTGWMGYAKENYKDDLMAGVRIYCRGKIAAQPSIFNLKSGFTGEYDVRSYLVGELHADWLDEEDDLIQTDRRDILWSTDLGQAFEKWGQSVVKAIGKISRNPMKQKSWSVFKDVSNIEKKVIDTFPLEEQKPIRVQALDLAKLVGQTMREGEIKDPERTDAIVELSLALAPHITLDQQLRQAADSEDSPLAVITKILKAARIAELSAFGRIATERIMVIQRLETLKDNESTLEAAFQELIEQAPWLIDPQWTPITANQTFSTLKSEFQKFYKEETGEELILSDFSDLTKRSDFVLSSQDNAIQIVEIKRPKHKFSNNELDRLDRYHKLMTEFMSKNSGFAHLFQKGFHITLVCDDEHLTGVHKTSFELMISSKKLTWMKWAEFLLKTRRMHEDFLKEAERQKQNVSKK